MLSGRVPTADGNPDFDLSTGQEPESYSAMNPYRAITEGNEETTMGKLDGKVAIVTGAARGLGRAYAKRPRSMHSNGSSSLGWNGGRNTPARNVRDWLIMLLSA